MSESVFAILIPVDAVPQEIRLAGLKGLQDAVGGYIEGAYLDDAVALYVNEEGKLNGMVFNPIATILWDYLREQAGHQVHGDCLVGPAVLVGMAEGDNADVPREYVPLLKTFSRSVYGPGAARPAKHPAPTGDRP